MRTLSISLLPLLSVALAACGQASPSASTGTGGAMSAAGEDSGGNVALPAGGSGTAQAGANAVAGADTGAGGNSGSNDLGFSDLPGKIRFINYVSNGTAGVDLDLYWGSVIASSEKVGTVHYGEITKFMAPRYAEQPMLAANQARFFLVPAGKTPTDPTVFLVRDQPSFDADTVLTVALASAGNDTAGPFGIAVNEHIFYEQYVTPPAAGTANVFEWSAAFAQIADHNFVTVGADGLCDPDVADTDDMTNLGQGVAIPAGTKGLALYDANTVPPCSSGASKVADAVEAGHSYLLLGEAEKFEASARHSVLLEVGAKK